MAYSSNDNDSFPLIKFESMLKTNNVLFFDSEEFENIIHHYLNHGKMSLAKKAIKLGLDQHPTSTNLKLFKVEVYVFENKLVQADALLNELYRLEPMNEEIYIQKANILSKKDEHFQAIEVLKQALELTDDVVDLYSLIGMEYLFLDQFEEAKAYFMKCLDEDIEDYFNHPAVKSICNYNRNVLDVRKRYDEKLYNILEDVNNIKIDYAHAIKEPLTERNICYYNKTRKRINKYWNDKKKNDKDLFIPADEENDKTQDMYIYEGLPVIAMKTKHDGDNILFANSETFNVGNIDNEYISLCCERPDENGEKEMYIYDCLIEDFRDYFLLNYLK